MAREGIRITFSSIRHPQGNIVERIHRELSRVSRSLVEERHNSWWKWVRIIENCMNETHHETTEFTPVELHLRTKPTRAWEKWLKLPPKPHELSHESKI